MHKKKSADSSIDSTTTKRRGTLKAHLATHAHEARLVEANVRLARELDRAKARTADIVAAIERTFRDVAGSLAVPPVPPPRRDARRVAGPASDEKALVVVSDVQLAKTTPTYNTEVAEARMREYAEKVGALTAIQRSDHPVREARVYLLGDIVEGELIFPSQPHQIDASLYRQVAVDGPRILCNFLRTMLREFERVHVVGVIGNHGAIGGGTRRFHNPETNADRMLYQFVRELLRDEGRLTWDVPYERNERAWYAVDYPFDEYWSNKVVLDKFGRTQLPPRHGFLLFHGDQIAQGANYSVGTLARRIWGWASGAVPESFTYAIHGHYHTPTRITMNNITLWQNGSTESTNTYAQERLAAVGHPTQLLMFVHPRRGVSAEYWVRLT